MNKPVGTLTVGTRLNDVADAHNIYIGRGCSRGQSSPLAHKEFVTRDIDHNKMCDMYDAYIKSMLGTHNPVRAEIERIAQLLLKGENVNLQAYGLIKHDRCITHTIEAILRKLLAKHS